METYLVFRRNGWRTSAAQRLAAASSLEQGEQMSHAVSWIRSYVVAEPDGSLGSVCVFQASSPEAVRAHAARAELPVDEIVEVAGTIVVRPDSEPAAAQREE